MIAEVLSHQLGVEELSPGNQIVHGDLFIQLVSDNLELAVQIEREVTLGSDIHVTLFDYLKDAVIRYIVFDMRLDQIQQICHLVVFRGSSSRSRYYHHAAVRIPIDNILNLGELFPVAK